MSITLAPTTAQPEQACANNRGSHYTNDNTDFTATDKVSISPTARFVYHLETTTNKYSIDDGVTATACYRTAQIAPPREAKSLKAVQTSLDEHALFFGHVIDRDGHLQQFGMAESENTDKTDQHIQRQEIPWLNVKKYWDTLDHNLLAKKAAHDNNDKGVPSLYSVNSYQHTEDNGPSELTKRAYLPQDLVNKLKTSATLSEGERVAVEQSIFRAAINDVPWSASFISFLMDSAGYEVNEFEYSASHIDYIRKAFDVSWQEANQYQQNSPSAYKYRACDVRVTPARPGDLICNMRSQEQRRASFAQITAVLRTDGGKAFYPTHCEIVTNVDQTNHVLTMLGGNVLQSIARRALRLGEGGTLDACYYSSASHCAGPFNNHNWIILLQHRDDIGYQTTL